MGKQRGRGAEGQRGRGAEENIDKNSPLHPCVPAPLHDPSLAPSLQPLAPQITADGSFTFFSPQFGEAFHSHYGARTEAQLKFAVPANLEQKAQQHQSLRLLDVCYGLGYNTAAALATIWESNPKCHVEVVGLELEPASAQAAISHHLLDSWDSPIPEILSQLATTHIVQTHNLQAKLLIGDARKTIQVLQASGFQADAIFLDPFSPPVCPQLWTVEFLERVARCLNFDGRLVTYSSSAAVRSALMAVGLKIGSTPPVGRRSPGTVASKNADALPALSQQEQEHLLTRAAIPYRDPNLSDCAELIRQRRTTEQNTSCLEPTNQWRKRQLKGVRSVSVAGRTPE